MDCAEVLVLGLLSDVLLPGEDRLVPEDSLEPASLKRMRKQKPVSVLALPIDFALQLPSFVVGRVGVVAEVRSLAKGDVRLAGIRRARVVAVGENEPFAASLELLDPPATEVVRERVAMLVRERGTELPVLRAIERTLGTQGWLANAITHGETAPEGRASAGPTAVESLSALRIRITSGLSPAVERDAVAPVIAELARTLGVAGNLSGRTLPAPLEALERKLEGLALSEPARRVARERLVLLAELPKNAHDYHTYLAHLELLAALPWGEPPASAVDLDEIERRLEQEHHGLSRAKRRIVEHLAVRALGGTSSGMVLCLAGPPGTGKTSIARSIADGLDRPLVRVPLGGVHDECEIRGHRQSFHAASPGRIVLGMRQAGRVDPVMLLDEIDKIGTDGFRSPAAALLEVLDPEQHHAFGDNFLGAPYDLSKVLFIATANDLSALAPALRDRMEVVELEGYTLAEKVLIAAEHLLPRLARRHGLPAPLVASPELLAAVVERYTREAGVRELDRVLAALHRVRAVAELRGGADASSAPLGAEEIARVLGAPRYRRAPAELRLPIGAAHGLSVSGDGSGQVLPVEVLRAPAAGPAPSLHLTGSLGEVMRESARAALSRLSAEAAEIGIADGALASDLHVHLPEGAIKKEGPSAGVAVYLAMRSALTGAPVRGDTAWTGEISLFGAVLAVGGVRAKVLAAERAGLAWVVVPEANRADVPPDVHIEIRFVEHLRDAAAFAFEGPMPPPPRASA
jgi:ATP-dependent Lon protease